MRKVLSFVLVLSLVLGSFGMAFAATSDGSFSDTSAEEVTVLAQLGVISGYGDGTYRPAGIVTRAEMAVIVIRALGLADYVGGVSGFPDMAGHAWAEGYVAYAKNLGIIDGYPDGTFKPGNTVTYQEAAKMMVAALGYTPDSLVGTWPANYVVKAQSLGILDGIVGGVSGANRGDIAKMTYQTMSESIGTVNKDGQWIANTVGGVLGADQMFTRLGATFNAAKVLTAADAASAQINIRASIGANAEYYTNKDGDIIAVKEKSTFLTGKMAGDKFKAAGVEYNISAAAAIPAMLNTAPAGTVAIPAGLAADRTIAVKVTGLTIDTVYSVHQWTVSDHDFFDKASAEDIKEDKSLFGYDFTLDKSNAIKASSFDLVGAASLDAIAEDAVVYVYTYNDGAADKIVKVAVGTEVVTGEITRVSGTDYTIGGKVYKKAVVDGGSDAVVAGDEVKAFLDFKGEVYKFEKLDGKADTYGIVLARQDGAGGFFGDKAQIRLFLGDDTAKIFDVDSNLSIAANAIYTGVPGATMTDANLVAQLPVGTPVLYGTNKDGKINDLDGFSTLVAAPAANSTISASGFLRIAGTGNAMKIASDALVLTYDAGPGNAADPDNYGVSAASKIFDSTGVTVYAYDVDTNGVIVGMFIEAGAVSDTATYGVVVGSATNNSDAGSEVSLLVNGEKVTYNTSVAYSKTVDLNLYKLSFNTAGDVTLNAHGGALATETVGAVNNITTSGNKVERAGTTYWLSENAVVYKYDTVDNVYKVARIRDIQTSTSVDILFYDVLKGTSVGTDGVYDFVVIRP